MSIFLTAVVRSKKGSEEALKALLLGLVSPSRQEKACLRYDLHQSLAEPDLFMFYEEWEDQDGLDFHNSQPYLVTFGEESKPFIEGKVLLDKFEKIA